MDHVDPRDNEEYEGLELDGLLNGCPPPSIQERMKQYGQYPPEVQFVAYYGLADCRHRVWKSSVGRWDLTKSWKNVYWWHVDAVQGRSTVPPKNRTYSAAIFLSWNEVELALDYIEERGLSSEVMVEAEDLFALWTPRKEHTPE